MRGVSEVAVMHSNRYDEGTEMTKKDSCLAITHTDRMGNAGTKRPNSGTFQKHRLKPRQE